MWFHFSVDLSDVVGVRCEVNKFSYCQQYNPAQCVKTLQIIANFLVMDCVYAYISFDPFIFFLIILHGWCYSFKQPKMNSFLIYTFLFLLNSCWKFFEFVTCFFFSLGCWPKEGLMLNSLLALCLFPLSCISLPFLLSYWKEWGLYRNEGV